MIQYYNVNRNWQRKIAPHLCDETLNKILVEDFNKYTFGRWAQEFKPDEFPRDYETCLWDMEHRGPQPAFWRYVKHGACHWLVNFNLRLAQLVAPRKQWRIITSEEHWMRGVRDYYKHTALTNEIIDNFTPITIPKVLRVCSTRRSGIGDRKKNIGTVRRLASPALNHSTFGDLKTWHTILH
jgi:hypothetical protein